MRSPSRPIVLEQYAEGLDALESLLQELPVDATDRRWRRTATQDWTVEELTRHLLAVAEWYHSWLDRAEAGVADAPFPSKQLDDRNELAVYDLRMMSGPEAGARFLERARQYLARLTDAADSDSAWDRPYGFARGTVTTGQHASAAAAEWHLHAWDLSSGDWKPSDAVSLYLGVAEAISATQPLPQRLITRRVIQIIARRDPWHDLLKRSGR